MANRSTHDKSVDISKFDNIIVPALAAIVFFLLFIVGPSVGI